MMHRKYTVVALFQSRPGQEAALRAALHKLLAPTRNEEGCLNYNLHEAPAAPGKFLFYENWTNEKTFQQHIASAHVKELLASVDQFCESAPEITSWEEIA